MRLKVFVKSIGADPRWDGGTGFDPDKPIWSVVFRISPAYDQRETSRQMEGYVTADQTLTVLYDSSPPFKAGDQVELEIKP